MAKRISEDDFVNEGLSDDEKAQIETGDDVSHEETEAETQADAAAPVLETEKPEKPAKEQPEKPEQPQMVDVRAIQEARAENRELKDQYRRLEERTNAMLKMLSEGKKEEPKDDDPEPDPNVDVFAHNAWLARQVKAGKEAAAREANERAQQQEAMRAEKAVWDYWSADSASYAKSNPDFGNAAKWLAEFREKQLEAFAVVDPQFSNAEARTRQINEELKAIVINAAQRKMSAADLVYQIAKGYGYQQAPQEPVKQAGPENIQRIAEQQERHRSLSDASGGEAPKPLDAKTLASMSDAQFAKLMADPSKAKEIDAIMGIA